MTVSTSDADVTGIGKTSASVRAVFRRFWPYVRGDRRLLGFAVLLLLVSGAAETVAIWSFGSIIDDALAHASLSGFWLPALTWVALAAIGGFASFGTGWLSAVVSERFVLRLRGSVYAHLQQLSPDFFAGYDTGDLLARLTNDIDAIEQFAASGVLTTVGAVITIVCYAGAAVVISWPLALAAFVLAPLFWLAARLFSHKIKTVSRDERDDNGRITAAVQEGLTNLTLVQEYNQQQADRRRLHIHGESWLRVRIREAKLSGAYTPLVDLAKITCLLLVIGAGVWEISRGQLTAGGVLAFTAYLGYLYPPLRDLGSLTITANAAIASSGRITELLDAQPTVTDLPHARVVHHVTGDLELDHVSYTYPGAARPALDEVSFSVRRGQLVLITGASGAGKSTITKLLLRFADPSAGSIRLDGEELRMLRVASLRDQVTLVPQHTEVFHDTVLANIAFGRPQASFSEIVAAASAADAHEFICGLPEGYHTRLDGAGQRLSGGQRQRLAIARAILRDTPVLVLDEPTAGLDGLATLRVIEPLRRLASGRTTIVISHDLSLAPLADRVLMLDQGRLVEDGRHEDLLRAGGPYARLYTRQLMTTSPEASSAVAPSRIGGQQSSTPARPRATSHAEPVGMGRWWVQGVLTGLAPDPAASR